MSIVDIDAPHNRSSVAVQEKRVALSTTMADLKRILASHFPTPPEDMLLSLRDPKGALIVASPSDDKMLGFYGVTDGCLVHVEDTRAAAMVDDFSDVSKVKKFEIAEEDYVKRPDNMRSFKHKMLEQQQKQLEAAGLAKEELHDDSFQSEAAAMSAGDRCKVSPGDRLGTVRYVGKIVALGLGYWVGVELDEPTGKNDGSLKGGQRVFECRPHYGTFVRPTAVEVGDFSPEEF